MNGLQIFDSPDFGEIRTWREEDGAVTFCAPDTARALGYSNTRDAINRHCNEDGVVFHDVIDSIGRMQKTKFITKGNLCRLAASSELPGADKFEHWIFDDVIPSVLEHGMYAVDQLLDDPDLAIQAFIALKEEREKRKTLETQAKADKPKVLFADAVATSKTSILVGELAKIIKQNGVDIGQNRFFNWLRDEGYLIKRRGTDYNMPTQKAMEMGLFEIKETVIAHSDGHTSITKTPKVTGNGQCYFINKFLDRNINT